MIATHLGFYNTASSRTHVRFQFSTHAAAGGNVAPNSAFEAADLRIYRANDGAAFSATQRSSAAGITMTSPFDSLTGFHDVDIDLTENTDAGFYASGYLYAVVLAPDETVDGQTITAVVLAYFEIGAQPVNVTHAAGTAWGSGAITAGSIAGDALTAAKFAADVATEINAAVLAILGTPAGASLAADLAAIEAQTDDIGVAGAGLTAIPWNAAWDAEVQSEATDALNAYDPPTRTEATADKDAILAVLGTPAGADLAADLADIEGKVDDVEAYVDSLETRLPATIAEVNSPPGATPTPAQAWAWLYAIAANLYTQTATEAKVRKNDGTVIGTAAVSDDGTTASRGQFA